MRRAPLILASFLVACDGAPSSSPSDAALDTAIADTTVVDSHDAAVGALRVLFIGNSYTYTNDIPGILVRIAATAGVPPTIETAQIVVGGATLQAHWTTGDAQKRINEKTWTHVVLQGQSVEPLLQPATFKKYAVSFADLIANTPAKPTFYVTWARAAGDAVYAETWSGGTPAAMQDGLTKAYADVATGYATGVKARVGEAFRKSLAERPALALHIDDRSHPTLAGSYLAACTFYVALTGSAVPAAAEVPAGIGGDDASFMRSIAVSVASAS